MKRTIFDASKDEVFGADEETTLCKVTGPGENLAILLATEYKSMRFKIKLDGRNLPYRYEEDWVPNDLNETGLFTYTPGITMAIYDDVNDWYLILITLPLKWSSSLEITAEHASIANQHAAAEVIYDIEAPPRPEPDIDVQEPSYTPPDPPM